jgi:hypothetical protein
LGQPDTTGYGHVVRADDFAHLAKIKGLRRLEIGFWGSDSEWATVDGEISKLEVLKQIESLSLNVDGIGDDDLRFVAKLPRLTSIELYAGGAEPHSGRKGPGCTDRCAEHLSKAAGLESLRFHGNAGLSDRFVDRLTAGARNLKELDLDASLVTDESLRMLADRCPKLERLSLSSAERLTDAGVGQLCRLEGIQSLRLSSGGISVEAAARITSLRELCLEGCVVTDQGVAALARLQGLERLVLYGPQLTDEQFGLFRDHPALQHMIVNGRRLTRDRTLPVLESMRSLRSASFVGNEALEQAAERMLRERGTPP